MFVKIIKIKKLMKKQISDIGVPDFDEHRQLYSVHMPYARASQCQQQKAEQQRPTYAGGLGATSTRTFHYLCLLL